MHNLMAVDAWLLAMRLVSVYTRADEISYGSRCMAFGMHRMAVDAWLLAMRLVSVYSRADAQSYSSRCMALGHAFGVCVYAG